MKNRLLTFAGALGIITVLGHFYAKPLLAQVRAALVQNVDEKGRNFYQVTGSCDVADIGQPCWVRFPAVPPNMRAVIEHVSVDLNPGAGPSQLDLFEDVSSAGGAATLSVFQRGYGQYYTIRFGSNESVLLYS